MSWADIKFFAIIEFLQNFNPDVLVRFSAFETVMKEVAEDPKIKEYLATRPPEDPAMFGGGEEKDGAEKEEKQKDENEKL